MFCILYKISLNIYNYLNLHVNKNYKSFHTNKYILKYSQCYNIENILKFHTNILFKNLKQNFKTLLPHMCVWLCLHWVNVPTHSASRNTPLHTHIHTTNHSRASGPCDTHQPITAQYLDYVTPQPITAQHPGHNKHTYRPITTSTP